MSIENIIWIGFGAIVLIFLIALLGFATYFQESNPSNEESNWKQWVLGGLLMVGYNAIGRYVVATMIAGGVASLTAHLVVLSPGLLILLVLAIRKWLGRHNEPEPPKPYNPPRRPTPIEPEPQPPLTPLPPLEAKQRELELVEVTVNVNLSTQNRLITLMNGDRAGATRLLEDLRYSYPHQSEQWVWEKAIFDIERDRQ